MMNIKVDFPHPTPLPSQPSTNESSMFSVGAGDDYCGACPPGEMLPNLLPNRVKNWPGTKPSTTSAWETTTTEAELHTWLTTTTTEAAVRCPANVS